jgi:hypothetical protein
MTAAGEVHTYAVERIRGHDHARVDGASNKVLASIRSPNACPHYHHVKYEPDLDLDSIVLLLRANSNIVGLSVSPPLIPPVVLTKAISTP